MRAEKFIDRAIKIEGFQDESLFLKAVIRYKDGKKKEAGELLENMKEKDDIYVKN